MDASQITKLLQKQNTRYINRSQTVDSSTLTWMNQIQSSKYIKGVKTCDGAQNTNVPTNPCCSNGNGIITQCTQSSGVWSSISGFPFNPADLNGPVNDIVIDPNGNIYVGGEFTQARQANGSFITVNYIAMWNGTSWQALGSGMNSGVNELLFTNGILYAGGLFTTAGGNPASKIASWNGSSWSALGLGITSGYEVTALASIGNIIYVGGNFSSAGGISNTNYIASWNGSSWSALGLGINGSVSSMIVDGNILYAGGFFTSAGGTSANDIASWNGTSWSALGLGITSGTGGILGLAIMNGILYAGGFFTTADGAPADNIASWNGSTWSALGTGMDNGVLSLAVNNGILYAGGDFTTAGGNPASCIASWNGSSWSALDSSFSIFVRNITFNGNTLYAGGAALVGSFGYIAKFTSSITCTQTTYNSPNNGTYNFGGSGRTTSLQTGSPQKFLNVLSGASGSASQVYSSESILLQQAGKQFCGVPGVSPAPQNSYVVLPGGDPLTSDSQLQVPSCSYLCTNTNGPTNGSSVPVNNQSNPYLPAFDTYYAMKNPSAMCKYPIQDQNQKHFVKQCHSRFPNANNGVNAVFNPDDNVTRMDPDTKQFYTYPVTNPDTCDGCILQQ